MRACESGLWYSQYRDYFLRGLLLRGGVDLIHTKHPTPQHKTTQEIVSIPAIPESNLTRTDKTLL